MTGTDFAWGCTDSAKVAVGIVLYCHSGWCYPATRSAVLTTCKLQAKDAKPHPGEPIRLWYDGAHYSSVVPLRRSNARLQPEWSLETPDNEETEENVTSSSRCIEGKGGKMV